MNHSVLSGSRDTNLGSLTRQHCQGPEIKAPKRKRAPDSDDEYAAASSDDDDFYDRCVTCD